MPDPADTEQPADSSRLGVAGRLTARFQSNALTPLLGLSALLAGLFALWVTPREEEPQIDVTFVNVFIPMPGASAEEVESLVVSPMEQILSEIQDGSFAREWILENQAGRPVYNSLKRMESEHLIEEVGAKLRQMMSWLKE